MQKTAPCSMNFQVAFYHGHNGATLVRPPSGILKPATGRFHRPILKKILLTMKLLFFFLFISMLSAHAITGKAQTVTISGKDLTIRQVFSAIEKQTGYVVLGNKALFSDPATFSLSVKDMPLKDLLSLVLKDKPMSYEIQHKTIFISKKAAPPSIQFTIVTALPEDTLITVKGRVLDERYEPVNGASVSVRETGKGVTTNVQGMFELKNVNRNADLVITYIGYGMHTFKANDKIQGSIILKKAESKLDEVQVMAYGVTSTRLSTGNITRISGEELRKQPAINPMLAMQGRVPGLVVTPTGGHQASPVKMEIRGRSSLNTEFSGDPLYIIDGVPQTILDAPNAVRYIEGTSPGLMQTGISYTGGQSPFFGLNAEDIESIEVLKDGDATAIYGSRGANGVVIITTRKPQPGRTSFTVQVNQERTDIARYPEMLDRKTYFRLRREAMRNGGIVPTPLNAPDLMLWDTMQYVNWQRELLQTGSNTRVLAALNGGDARNAFRLSTSYNTIRSIDKIPNNNGALNVTFGYNHKSSNRKFTMDINLTQVHTFTEAVRMGATSIAPNAPSILDSVGKPNYAAYQGLSQVVRYEWAPLFQPSKAKTYRLSSSINMGYVITDELRVGVNVGFNNGTSNSTVLMPLASLDPFQPGLTGSASFDETKTGNWKIDPTINYLKHIGRGRLDVMLAAGFEQATTTISSIYGSGYTNDDLLETISAAAIKDIADGFTMYRYGAVFGRINYQHDGKYIVTFNGRRDGSSRFGPGRQFGNFGSVGLAWIASEEAWWKKNIPSLISFFKLRGSYGITGNDNIGEYQYLSQWSGQLTTISSSILYDYNGIRPVVPIHAVNQLFHWETVRKLELAAEIEIAKKHTLSLSWYRDVCDDQLTSQPTPVYSGFGNVVTNSPATVENKGFEASINAKLLQGKQFSWTANFNIALNRNRLLAYPNLARSRHASQFVIGGSLRTAFLFRYLGVDPLTGDYMFEDYNKDGIVTSGNNIPGAAGNDAYIQKDMMPSFGGGFGTTVSWKGLMASLHFVYSKQPAYDPFFQSSISLGRMGSVFVPAEVLDNIWTKPGDIAKYGPPTTFSGSNIRRSDIAIIDGSFLQLNNVSISWGVPAKVLKPARLSNARISINANNIYTITRYAGVLSQGLNSFSQPLQRNIALAVQFTF